MLRELLVTLTTVFITITGYYLVVPIYTSVSTQLGNIGTPLITDSILQNAFTTLITNLNVILQYSIVAILIGLILYLALVPFREEVTSYS
jgi:hypothetical protein